MGRDIGLRPDYAARPIGIGGERRVFDRDGPDVERGQASATRQVCLRSFFAACVREPTVEDVNDVFPGLGQTGREIEC